MAQAIDEREARRAYVHRRQRIVFTVTGAIMAVVLVLAILVTNRVINLQPRQANDAREPNYGLTAPCAAKNQDGTPMKWPENQTTKIRVLNGTEGLGLANAVNEELINRHFTIMENPGNYTSSKVQRTMIVFGEQAINNAYALARNFNDAQLVMDDRTDRLVDVVIGATFNDLRSAKAMEADGDTITDIKGCVPAEQMKQEGLPKAPRHTPVD